MRKIFIFLIGFLILFSSWGAFTVYENYFGSYALEKEVYSHLESVAYSKANRVGFFLDERKADLEFLVGLPDIRNSFETSSIDADTKERLTFFQETNNYLDLILIDINGRVLWTAKQKDFIGIDLNSLDYVETKLGEIYNKVKNDFGVGIFDPGYYEEDEQLSVFVTSPVLVESETIEDKKDMIGIIAMRIDNSEIEKLVISDIGLREGKIYLVNKDGTPITSLTDNSGRQVTEIKTKLSDDCFKDYNNYYFSRRGESVDEVAKSGLYENHLGKTVFGAHHYILQTGWCVMTEINRNEFYDSLKNKGEKR